MKMNKILKDILKLHPELEKDKPTLKKTVKFLSMVEPKVVIDANFKAELWERLDTLATLKSESVKDFSKKPWFLHIFWWVFASLLAFFWLFYVIGDSLFYDSEIPTVNESKSRIFDADSREESESEIEPKTGISEPSPVETKSNSEIQNQETPERKPVPKTIIIREDGASQVDVSESERLQIQPQSEPVESSPTTTQSSTTSDDMSDSADNQDMQDDSGNFSEDASDDSMQESMPMWGWWAQGMDASMMRMSSPESSSAADASFSTEVNQESSVQGEAFDELQQEVEAIFEEFTDEFTLQCNDFWWEVSIIDEKRTCNIWDIVCSEPDFLEWVCELGN